MKHRWLGMYFFLISSENKRPFLEKRHSSGGCVWNKWSYVALLLSSLSWISLFHRALLLLCLLQMVITHSFISIFFLPTDIHILCIIFIPLIRASFQILMILRFLSLPAPSFESRPMHPTAYWIFLSRHSCKSVTATHGEIIKIKSTLSPVHFILKAAIQQILDACFLPDPL